MKNPLLFGMMILVGGSKNAPLTVQAIGLPIIQQEQQHSQDLPSMTRTECLENYHGSIVGDIGNGAIYRPDYVCESNGRPPIGRIIVSPGEPIAIEGEVCCGPPE